MADPPLAAVLAFDREHLWHPYTSMSDPPQARVVSRAAGSRLVLGDGREVIDAMSSWWSAIHGHGHPALTRAATAQLHSLGHVMFGGLTHEPAVALAARLLGLAPPGLEHVFFADSGSVGVEVALKMVLQYQRGAGRPGRTRLLTVRGGYHGDTFGCMGVCDPVDGMHAMFAGVLHNHVFAPRPPAIDDDPSAVDRWARQFEELAERHADELAGIIVEPVLQGAGGMHIYPASCLTLMREVADRHALVLVLDEIATGFGRTGTMFAAEHAGVTPDVMCVGKALTGGVMTLAAVLCTPEVAAGVSRSESGVLMHGPTYMANPLACAVAAASIDVLTGSDWRGNVARIGRGLDDALAVCSGLPGVADVRTIGAVGVVQLDHSVEVAAATDAALDEGVWLRPFRDLIYTMPPYICTVDEVAAIGAAITAAAEVG